MKAQTLVVVPMLVALSAHAEEWTVTPGLNTRVEYAENPRLDWEGGEVSTGAIVDAGFDLARRSETAQLSLSSSIQHRAWAGEDSLDSTDTSTRVAWRHTGERYSTSLEGAFKRDSTVTSEVGSTGYTQENKRREVTSLGGSWGYELTDRIAVDASAAASDTQYRKAARTGLVDYEYVSASLGASFVFTDRLQASLATSWGDLSVPDAPDSETHQYGVTAQLVRVWSPLWRSTLFAGPERVVGRDDTDMGASYGLSLSRSGDVSSLLISLDRAVEPNGRGVLARRETLAVTGTFRSSERLSTELQLTAQRSADVVRSQPSSREVVEYGRISAALAWHWTQHLRTRFAVTFRAQRSDVNERRAEDAAVALGIVWTPAAMLSWQ